MTAPHLAAHDIACRRGDRILFCGVNLALGPGDALHLAGPNGIGKSSLIRILAGLMRPFAGTVERSGNLALFESLDQRSFLDQFATRAVHDAHALFGLGQTLGIEHVLGLRGERHVHGDEVGLRDDGVEALDEFHLQRAGAAGREIRIVGEHAHAESDGAAGDLRPDPAHAEDGERLIV